MSDTTDKAETAGQTIQIHARFERDELEQMKDETGAISQRIREEKIRAGEPEQEEMDLGGAE